MKIVLWFMNKPCNEDVAFQKQIKYIYYVNIYTHIHRNASCICVCVCVHAVLAARGQKWSTLFPVGIKQNFYVFDLFFYALLLLLICYL